MIIDVDALREHMEDYCGTAAFSGFPAAAVDLFDIQRMGGHQLCRKAEEMGIDLSQFEVEPDDSFDEDEDEW